MRDSVVNKIIGVAQAAKSAGVPVGWECIKRRPWDKYYSSVILKYKGEGFQVFTPSEAQTVVDDWKLKHWNENARKD